MIKCPVCLAENDEFAVTCTQCKAYLQDRVPNLNFFEIVWKVLESPRKAFRIITLAEHKNYVFFLFSLFGISVSFTLFCYLRLGRYFDTLLDLIPWAVGVGIVSGVLAAFVLTGVYHVFARLLGGSTAFRNSRALLGYSLTPIALSLFVVLPIELMTFGMYLFTSNPHPFSLKPISYVVLVGFELVVAVWSIMLAILGTRVGHQMSATRSAIVVLGTVALFGIVAILATQPLGGLSNL
jgi:hypothetical protein